uniref:Group II intron maturase-specific domain-containing protein n=1 Tax=Gracilaria hainanensis TaxID=2871843 RepID=A0AAU7YPU8_9FLOR
MYNCLIYECKNLLYNKDSLKRLRFNNHMQLKQITHKLFNLLTIFFKYHNILMSFKTVQKTYKLFSSILYSWYKKKYKRIVRLPLHNFWNSKFFVNFIISIRVNLLYIIFLEQINR